ncbi:MAG: ATP-binding protein [Methylococcales bacterium]|nr:ATP-binding protein [Methylococcales bacterium]
MKLKLFAKLFLLLFLGMLLLLSSTVLTLHLNFKQGLATYLQNSEQEKLEQLVVQLGDYYGQHGSWDGLQNNPRAWFQWLAHSAVAKYPLAAELQPPPSLGDQPPFADDGPLPGNRHRPPPRHHRPHKDAYLLDIDRLFIFDQDGQKINGPPFIPQESEGDLTLPIQSQGQTIGLLLVTPNTLITDHLVTEFMHQQLNGNLWRLGFALLFSILMAVLMARQILRPLRRVTKGMQALAAGRYSTQIPDRGHDELAALAQDFNFLGRTLAHSEHTRQQWLADISHELRTPLAVLRGELEALVDGIRTPTPERINSLHQEVMGLTRLVDDLYQLSLSDLGALDYQFERLELGQLLTHIIGTFQARFNGKNIRLSLNYPPAAVMINGDTMRLAQLINNLLENSFRYTDAGGSCQVTLSQQQGTALIRIEDSAPGVAEAELPLLFDRFHRTDRSRQRQLGGAGLGLAICRNIADAHNGSINATASALGGVCISVILARLM